LAWKQVWETNDNTQSCLKEVGLGGVTSFQDLSIVCAKELSLGTRVGKGLHTTSLIVKSGGGGGGDELRHLCWKGGNVL